MEGRDERNEAENGGKIEMTKQKGFAKAREGKEEGGTDILRKMVHCCIHAAHLLLSLWVCFC